MVKACGNLANGYLIKYKDLELWDVIETIEVIAELWTDNK